MTDKSFDLNVEREKPNAFIQWKGTDLCMDFRCECGANCHFDGYCAYSVKCPHCNQTYEMPDILFPRKVDKNSDKAKYARLLEQDEDFKK